MSSVQSREGAAKLTRCPSGQGALCKSADAGSIPALVSTLQWLERRGTDLLNRHMLVRIQSGAPLFFWPRSSMDERRFPTSEDARSSRVAVASQLSAKSMRGWRTG